MNSIISHLLAANLLLLAVALYHRLFLSRQRRFGFNRFFLLSGSVLAFVLPLLRISVPVRQLDGIAAFGKLPEVIVSGNAAVTAAAIDWMEIALLAYLGLAAALSIGFGIRMVRLSALIARSPKEAHSDYTLVKIPENIGPASFFRYLLWPSHLKLDARSSALVLAHERCHIRQWHSLDLLWMEALRIACWFNPAVYMLRKDLRRTHEFLADEAASQSECGVSLRDLILQRHFGSQHHSIANHFQSQIKVRLNMLNTKSKPKSLLPYLMVIPLAALLFACSTIETDPPQDDSESAQKTQVDPESAGTNVSSEDPAFTDLQTLETEPKPIDFNDFVQKMGYPDKAKKAKAEGKVIIRVKVGKTGDIEEQEILRADDPLLETAVLDNISNLKFEPGMKDGQAVKAWVTIPFNFKL